MPKPTTFEVSVADGVTVIHFNTDLFDLSNIASLRDELPEFVSREKPAKVLVDFDRVRKFGSEAVGILIDATKRVRGTGGDVRLCSMSKFITEMFQACRLIPTTFQVYRSAAEGIGSYE